MGGVFERLKESRPAQSTSCPWYIRVGEFVEGGHHNLPALRFHQPHLDALNSRLTSPILKMFDFNTDLFGPDFDYHFLEGNALDWYTSGSDLPVAGPSKSRGQSPYPTPTELPGPSVTDLVTTPSPPTDICKYLRHRHLRLRFSRSSTL